MVEVAAGVGELPFQSIVGAVVEVDVEKIVSSSAKAAYRSEADGARMAPPPPPLDDGAGDRLSDRLPAAAELAAATRGC